MIKVRVRVIVRIVEDDNLCKLRAAFEAGHRLLFEDRRHSDFKLVSLKTLLRLWQIEVLFVGVRELVL